MTETFPSIKPTYGVRKSSAPIKRVVRFADGYEQRVLFGLHKNQNPKSYSLTFKVSETDADRIEDFLEARGLDQECFNYTPEGESAGKFVCDSWSKSIPYLNRATIQATFRQVFEADS